MYFYTSFPLYSINYYLSIYLPIIKVGYEYCDCIELNTQDNLNPYNLDLNM